MTPEIIIWGIGDRTKLYLRNGYFEKCKIKGFVDSLHGGEAFWGKEVWNPGQLPRLMQENTYLVICNWFLGEIYDQCLDMGIDRKKIVFTDWIEESFAKCDMELIQRIEPRLIEKLKQNRYKLIAMNEKDAVDSGRLVGNEKYANPIYMHDYFRYRSFEYAAELLEEEHVRGAVAELGVFRGYFSSLINQKFPDRKLYLFDTFEGFDKEETDKEAKKGRCDEMFVRFHADTSVGRMLANLPFPEQCQICKGFFPRSVTKEVEKESFAFVSIDVDFEDSIYEGLDFFYPRMNCGGIIFLHDYNSAFLPGVKTAVKRYEQKIGCMLRKVPLADRAGTLVIMK